MEEWLRTLNVMWKQQNCHVFILLDNQICHPCHELPSVLLVHFPANTTSVSQHMDQSGLYSMTVIQYSSYVLCHWTWKFHFSPCAVIWIVKVRKQLCLQTLQRCFQKSKIFCIWFECQKNKWMQLVRNWRSYSVRLYMKILWQKITVTLTVSLNSGYWKVNWFIQTDQQSGEEKID